jgi:hypothetical protein
MPQSYPLAPVHPGLELAWTDDLPHPHHVEVARWLLQAE